jgi:hypothetical protein
MTAQEFLDRLAAYREMFWPDFVEHDDCVFLAFNPQYYVEWLEKCGGDKTRVEAMMNHRHITDSLPQAVQEPTRELVVAYGRLLREAWDAKLWRDFPHRRFVVSFPEVDSPDLGDYEVTFWQPRNET